jgi:hypothetical protein
VARGDYERTKTWMVNTYGQYLGQKSGERVRALQFGMRISTGVGACGASGTRKTMKICKENRALHVLTSVARGEKIAIANLTKNLRKMQ